MEGLNIVANDEIKLLNSNLKSSRSDNMEANEEIQLLARLFNVWILVYNEPHNYWTYYTH